MLSISKDNYIYIISKDNYIYILLHMVAFRTNITICSTDDYCNCLRQQMQSPLPMLTLALVLVQSTWLVFTAMVVKAIFWTVPVAPVLAVPLATVKMLECGVKVCLKQSE